MVRRSPTAVGWTLRLAVCVVLSAWNGVFPDSHVLTAITLREAA